jgi:hypothetical protein
VAPAVLDVLALAHPRRRTVDDQHFVAIPDPQAPSTCRVQLFTAPGHQPVALATQGRYEGRSLTSEAEAFAGAAWATFCPDQPPPVWIEHHVYDGESTGLRLVTLDPLAPGQLANPVWTTITPGQVEELVGRPVALDRGDQYVPREAPPEPEQRYATLPVRSLPQPRPFRQPRCMPGGTPAWRRRARRILPLVPACCWYHRGDWHQVSLLALRLVHEAQRTELHFGEIHAFVLRTAKAERTTKWQLQALDSLLEPSTAIQLTTSGQSYVNGQHRAQALLDAGVQTTVVLIEDAAM